MIEKYSFAFGSVVCYRGPMNLFNEQEPLVRTSFIYCCLLALFACAGPEEPTPARAALHDGAQRALQNRDQAKVMKIGTPIKAALRVVPPASLRAPLLGGR